NGIELQKNLEGTPNLPDLVFLDLNMPLKNGMDCLRDIRLNNRFVHLPVVILSTSAQEETVARAYQTGADLYVKKPNSIIKLRTILNRILIIHKEEGVTRQPWERFLID